MTEAGRRRRAGALLAISALLVSFVPSIPAAATGPTWTIQASPNRAGVANTLSDVSCPSATKCVAVGAYRNNNAIIDGLPAGPLIETFAAGKWAKNSSPGQGGLSRLSSVSCPTWNRCYAIGQSHTATEPLIVTSSGGPWTQMTSPTIADPTYFASISCADETHCVAVGLFGSSDLEPIILSLANGVWSLVAPPDFGASRYDLRSVSCVTATRCFAVGRKQFGSAPGRTLVIKLAGGTWTVMPTPNRTANSNWFTGISCTAVTRCTASGEYSSASTKTRTLIGSWNGTAWTLVPSPNRGPGHHALVDVSCAVASRCVAVGIDGNGLPLILRLAGGVWSIDPSPQLPLGYSLFGVDCITAAACVAVGSQGSTAFLVSKTIVLRSGG